MKFEYTKDSVLIGNVFFPIDEFLMYEATFKVPDVDSMIYEKGKLKGLIKDGNQYGDENYDWEALDVYIGRVDNYLALREANKPTPPKPSYKDFRADNYGSITEQLDMLYWDKINGTNLWMQHIEAVKSKYPKEN